MSKPIARVEIITGIHHRRRHRHQGRPQQILGRVRDESPKVLLDHDDAAVVRRSDEPHRQAGAQAADDGAMAQAVGDWVGAESSASTAARSAYA